MARPALFVLLVLLTAGTWADGAVTWRPGTLIQSEYRELAGTVIWDPASPPVFRAEGNEYVLMLLVQPSDIPGLKNRTAMIMKGISGVVALPGQPVQRLFWPIECRIRNQTIPMPDPTESHWRWLQDLEKGQ